MQPAIVNVSTPPETTLSVDTTVYKGMNQIRRNIAHSTSLYAGASVVDRSISLEATDEVTILEPGKVLVAVYIKTDMPILILVGDETEPTFNLKVARALVLDHQVSRLIITSDSVANPDELTTNIQLAYIYKNAPPAEDK